MTAQPVEDPDPLDPQVIIAELPEWLRPQFVREYRAGVEAARDLAGYGSLQQVLRRWKVRSRLEATRARLQAGAAFIPISAILGSTAER